MTEFALGMAVGFLLAIKLERRKYEQRRDSDLRPCTPSTADTGRDDPAVQVGDGDSRPAPFGRLVAAASYHKQRG